MKYQKVVYFLVGIGVGLIASKIVQSSKDVEKSKEMSSEGSSKESLVSTKSAEKVTTIVKEFVRCPNSNTPTISKETIQIFKNPKESEISNSEKSLKENKIDKEKIIYNKETWFVGAYVSPSLEGSIDSISLSINKRILGNFYFGTSGTLSIQNVKNSSVQLGIGISF